MPTLKQLTCTVEWTGSNVPLREFQPTYGDGYVHTFIAVPPLQTPFSVHLTSHGYIAPGLAMFVYMDGEYQCNRNRRNLRIPDENTRRGQTEIDFRVRQKEELQPDGSFCGQQWKFRELKIVSDPSASIQNPAPHDAEHVGTIEVVVLRCYPNSVEEKPSFRPAFRPPVVRNFTPDESSDSSSEGSSSQDGSEAELGGLFDGAGDQRPHKSKSLPFGGDATSDRHWNYGGQGSPIQGDNSQAWEGATNNHDMNRSGNGWGVGAMNTQSPRWDTHVSTPSPHFSNDWNRPSQTTQEPAQHGSGNHSSHGSRRSGRSSSSNHNAQAVSVNNDWGASNPAHPSPAIVINVNQSPVPSRFGPPSVAGSWAERSLPDDLKPSHDWSQPPQGHANSPNGSNQSGSNRSGSNKSNGSPKNNNNGNGWQGTAGQTHNWGAEAPAVPGAWETSGDKPQETSEWNKNSGPNWEHNNSGTTWEAPNNQSSNGQNNEKGNSWNNAGEHGGWQDNTGNENNDAWNKTSDNGGWQNNNDNGNGEPWNNTSGNGGHHNDNGNGPTGQAQGGNLTNEEVLKNYPDWASPNPQNQQSNNWPNGNLGNNGNGIGQGSANGEKPEQPAWGADNRNNSIQDEPVGLFGSKPIPASESAKREGSIKLKHSNEAPAFSFGQQQSPTTAKPPVTTNPQVAGAVQTSSRAKPYWSTWNLGPLDQIEEIEEEPAGEPESEEGPLYTVPADIAERSNMSHQVQIGKPAVYLHKVSKPKYMDTHDNPYAAFTFNYRSRAVIEKMFGVSLAETEEEEKERLSYLSKEELIEHYLKAKASASSQKSSSGSNDSNKQGAMMSGGLGLGGELANKLSHLQAHKAPSEQASTDPEVHWGRPANQASNWNTAATASNANVAGWLSNGGGGGVGSPPKENSGGSNNGYGSNGQNGNSWNQNGNGGNSNTDQNGNANVWGDNGGGNQQGRTWNNGGGNEASWNPNGGGNATGGSWNGAGNDNQNKTAWNAGANQNDSSWNNSGGVTGNQNQNSWNSNGGGNGNQNDNSWNKGAATTSLNAGAGDAPGEANAGVEW